MKYAVIAYNFNNYEIMREIPDNAVNDEIEYIYITDNPAIKSKHWKIVIDHDLDNLSAFDKCYSVRFNLFKYTDADVILYIDGSIQILNDVMRYITEFVSSGKELGIMIHSERTTMWDEYRKWVQIRNYPKIQAFRCLAEMDMSGYDIKQYKGLYQGCMRFIKRTKNNFEIDKQCLEMLKRLGEPNKIERLDQTIFSYLLNTKFFYIDCFTFSDSCIYSDVLNIQRHGQPFKFSGHPARPYIHNGYFRNKLIHLQDL